MGATTLATILAFCSLALTMTRAQDPRLEDDLFLRKLLLRQYLDQQQAASMPLVFFDQHAEQPTFAAEQQPMVAAVSNFWRQRRTPAERAKLFRLSDQYTPTPCRWKLCASIFKGDFKR